MYKTVGSANCPSGRHELIFSVNVGPTVTAELEALGPPPSLPTRLPRVGACSFTLHPISLSALHRIHL